MWLWLRKAPHVIMDDILSDIRTVSSFMCCRGPSQGQSVRKTCIISRQLVALHRLCHVGRQQWPSALCAPGECLGRSQGYRHPARMDRPTHSVPVATAHRGGAGGVDGGGLLPTAAADIDWRKWLVAMVTTYPSSASLLLTPPRKGSSTWEE